MRIRTKLIIAFLLSGVIPLLVVFGVSLGSIRHEVEGKFAEHVAVTAELAERTVTLYLDGLTNRVQDWSTDGYVNASVARLAALPEDSPERAGLSSELNTYLRERKLPLDRTVLIAEVFDADGRVVASSEPLRLGHSENANDLEHEYAWSRAMDANPGQAVTSGVVSFEGDEQGHPSEPTLHFSAPLAKEGGTPGGVLVLHVSARNLASLLGELHSEDPQSTFETYLVNKDGYFATPSRYVPDAVLKVRNDTEPVRRCQGSVESATGRWDDYRGVQVIGASRCQAGRWWTLVTEIDQAEVDAAASSARAQNALVLLVTLAVAIALGISLSVMMGRRVGKCTAVIKDLAQGKFDARVPEKDIRPDEIGEAAEGVNAMAERLDDYFGSLNQLYETVFNEVPVGIATVGKDGKVRSANARAVMSLGAKEGDDLLASRWVRESGLEEKLRAALGGEPFEASATGPGDTSFSVTAVPISGRKEGETLVLVEDVTQRERLVAQQRTYAARLEEAVAQRTKELEAEKSELERTNAHLVGRELRMAELKKRLAEFEGNARAPDNRPPDAKPAADNTV